MRDYLERAPWWVWSLIFGSYLWVIMVVSGKLFITHDWVASIVGGFVGAAFFGVFMGPRTARRLRRVLAGTAQLSAAERRAAAKAVARGPIPADDEVRQAAVWMANDQLTELHRSRLLVLAVCVLFVALTIFVAVTSSAWYLMGVGVFCGLFALHVWQERRLRRRARLLEG